MIPHTLPEDHTIWTRQERHIFHRLRSLNYIRPEGVLHAKTCRLAKAPSGDMAGEFSEVVENAAQTDRKVWFTAFGDIVEAEGKRVCEGKN